MKIFILFIVMGVAVLSTACANHGHEHKGNEHSSRAHAHHSQPGNDHHNSDMGNHHGDSVHGDGHHGPHGNSLAGHPGSESEVDRTIRVVANDAMRFVHEPIKVTHGETIKFEVTNTGAIPHEFSIGTKDEHMAHGKMMMANPDMHHGPGGASITIAPGKTETLIWNFKEASNVQAACNLPGHYQAGMHSNIDIEK